MTKTFCVLTVLCGWGLLTSIIAAETSGRVCHGLELDPAYVDVIVTRWAAFTGEEPMLIETGETFDIVRNRRVAQVG